MTDYRAILRPKGLRPITVERTRKEVGDLVLTSWAKPAERVTEVGR